MTESLREALHREANAVSPPELFGPALRARPRKVRRGRWVTLGAVVAAAAAAAVLAVTLPASHDSIRLPGGGDAQPILDAADRAAKGNGGKAVNVEAVKTTRGAAGDFTGHPTTNTEEVVWVVQVSGSHYVCGACSMPPGATAPRGDYLTMVLRASDWQGTDGGISPQPSDLRPLGDLAALRGTTVASDRAALIDRCVGHEHPDYTTPPSFSPADYLGLTESEAATLAAQQGQGGLRVVCRDGEGLARTSDLRPTRVNLILEDGKVIWAGRF
jgi:hypothetical protein